MMISETILTQRISLILMKSQSDSSAELNQDSTFKFDRASPHSTRHLLLIVATVAMADPPTPKSVGTDPFRPKNRSVPLPNRFPAFLNWQSYNRLAR